MCIEVDLILKPCYNDIRMYPRRYYMQYRACHVARAVVVTLLILEIGAPAAAAEDASSADLMKGVWVVLFGKRSECLDCDQALAWIADGQEAFPEFSFTVSISGLGGELAQTIPSGVTLYSDSYGQLRTKYSVGEIPTIIILAQGLAIRVLEWPFTRGGILRALAEAVLIAGHIPKHVDLLGMQLPEFSAVDLDGNAVVSGDLEFPVVLGFLKPGCASCPGSAPTICSISGAVNAVLLLSYAVGDALEQFVTNPDLATCSDVTIWIVDERDFVPKFGITRSPSYFYISEEGVVQRIHSGYATESEILELLESFSP
jgi:hypothetical protein